MSQNKRHWYFPMQELVDYANLLLYSILSKFAFQFCPPFVHENIKVPLWDNFICTSLGVVFYSLQSFPQAAQV